MHLFSFILFFIVSLTIHAQVSFKTIVPLQPVAQGESFQVQYVIENGDNITTVKPPVFNNFRLVAGPNIYSGSVSSANGLVPLRNFVYTLEAIRPGKFSVPGAAIVINGKTIRSNSVLMKVITKAEAAGKYNRDADINNSAYFLRPGEDPYQKIRQNLFVKVMVDKRNCFVGEPVLATFKLYSRLQSKSDIIKNPGLYGFSVYDMENLESKIVVIEKINGKYFDVHTIRKVQLFPLQEGTFLIDPMLIKNKVAFSKSSVGKKTEQEITEGILGQTEETPDENTVVYESDLTTEEIAINVKSLPVKNKPASFTGGTGLFTIEASTAATPFRQNEHGFLNVTIKGEGNFIQLDAPAIQWPQGMESFPPTITDDFDKTKMPLSGSRTFRYPVVCVQKGEYKIPPVVFSFFSKKNNAYKEIASKETLLTVTAATKKYIVTEEHKEAFNKQGEKTSRKALFIVFAIVAGILLVLFLKKKKKPVVLQEPVKPVSSVDEILQPAREVLENDGKEFYSTLHKAIWQFASQKFELAGSEQNKSLLEKKLTLSGISEKDISGLFAILEECETAAFTQAGRIYNKEELLLISNNLLNRINLNFLQQT